MGALEEVRDLAESVAGRRDLRLWDVELGGGRGNSVVRVYVDAEAGVDLDTVAEVSQELSRGLDLRDPFPGRYVLEVSSPGLERSLKRPEHFSASVGKKVTMKTKRPLNGSSHRIDGLIRSAGPAAVQIELEVAGGSGEPRVEVPYDQVKTARTVFEWQSE
ncbi:MAG: ribosome maturation factor RimP [Actinomycetota bacterium]|nr:ribosome maturation factor RimP [Actinomycetota bacterium]